MSTPDYPGALGLNATTWAAINSKRYANAVYETFEPLPEMTTGPSGAQVIAAKGMERGKFMNLMHIHSSSFCSKTPLFGAQNFEAAAENTTWVTHFLRPRPI